MSDDHVSLPVRVPSLSHLSNDELQALRNKIASISRDARRKANLLLGKNPGLKGPWLRSISLKTNDPDRVETLAALEREVVKHPEAFLAYAYVNSLFVMDTTIREEMLRRSLPGNGPPSKKKALPVAPTPKETAPSMMPWELDENAGP